MAEPTNQFPADVLVKELAVKVSTVGTLSKENIWKILKGVGIILGGITLTIIQQALLGMDFGQLFEQWFGPVFRDYGVLVASSLNMVLTNIIRQLVVQQTFVVGDIK